MTRFLRIAAASLFSLALLAAAVTAGGSSAQAAAPYSVTVAPVSETFAVGETAIFRVKVQGQTANLPSFDFDVEGGTLEAVASIDPTAANVAEGAVFVTRANEGTARLTVRLSSEVLATGQARFANLGTVSVNVSLDAGPDAAARTWRYEVLSSSGSVVASLVANTSGDAPQMLVSSIPLPYGFYTVRQVLGSDTATSCAAGSFYTVAAPVSGATTIELTTSQAIVNFTIAPCPSLPADLRVLTPVDTIAPAPGIVGDAVGAPGEAPISEVRGARDENPNFPLPPRAGDSPQIPEDHARTLSGLLIITGFVTAGLAGAAYTVTRLTSRKKQ